MEISFKDVAGFAAVSRISGYPILGITPILLRLKATHSQSTLLLIWLTV
jgi:hypothetical protein